MTTKEKYNKEACFNLIAEAIEYCTRTIRISYHKYPRRKKETNAQYKIRIYPIVSEKMRERQNFMYGTIIEMWCDCSYNFERDKLIKNILKRMYENNQFLMNIK